MQQNYALSLTHQSSLESQIMSFPIAVLDSLWTADFAYPRPTEKSNVRRPQHSAT
ncbi:hypothetical protein Mapa_004315 [Marchantia paleacea]|nr:hypothetical protein Mapa_004315 [Marchantia paleacea]